MQAIHFGKFELKIEPLLRSAGNVYFVLNKSNKGRKFESLCKRISRVIGKDYRDIEHQLTPRRKWSKLSRGKVLALEALARDMSSQ